MPDDKTKKAPQDSSRINVNEKYELEYWSKEWGITSEKLKETVKKVGPMVKDVKKALGK